MFPVSCAPFLRFGTLEPEEKRLGVWKLPNMESGSPAPAQEIETRQAIGDGSENVFKAPGTGKYLKWERKLTASCTAKCSNVARLCAPAAFTFGGIAYGYY